MTYAENHILMLAVKLALLVPEDVDDDSMNSILEADFKIMQDNCIVKWTEALRDEPHLLDF